MSNFTLSNQGRLGLGHFLFSQWNRPAFEIGKNVLNGLHLEPWYISRMLWNTWIWTMWFVKMSNYTSCEEITVFFKTVFATLFRNFFKCQIWMWIINPWSLMNLWSAFFNWVTRIDGQGQVIQTDLNCNISVYVCPVISKILDLRLVVRWRMP